MITYILPTYVWALVVLVMAGTAPGLAQEETELAKQVQNPVTDLISVSFQSNFNFGVGPDDDLQYILSIQPVMPFRLTGDWNLITRTILPSSISLNWPRASARRSAWAISKRHCSSLRQNPAQSFGASAPYCSSRRRQMTFWAQGNGVWARRRSG
jgi:hypothetical protein